MLQNVALGNKEMENQLHQIKQLHFGKARLVCSAKEFQSLMFRQMQESALLFKSAKAKSLPSDQSFCFLSLGILRALSLPWMSPRHCFRTKGPSTFAPGNVQARNFCSKCDKFLPRQISDENISDRGCLSSQILTRGKAWRLNPNCCPI